LRRKQYLSRMVESKKAMDSLFRKTIAFINIC
jgi:hypothetical protein